MTTSKLAAVLALSLLFFTTAHGGQRNPPTPPVSPPNCPAPPVSPPQPPTPPPQPPTPPVSPPPPPTPPVSPPPPPTPTPPPPNGSCPINVLQLAVCANVLHLLQLNLPVPPGGQCCPLLSPLVDLDAAVCLCTALQANILGISVNLTLDTTLLLNYCGKTCPPGFTCPRF